MNTIYFSSDHHLGHKNILKYSKRPFSTIQEHDQELVNRHNSIVKPNDIVYFLGDFSLGQPKDFLNYIWQFNGFINYVFGNHDRAAREILRRQETRGQYQDLNNKVKFLGDYAKIRFNNQKIILTHYPFLTWDGKSRGVFHLHGHCHYNLPCSRKESQDIGKILDVGVDGHNYQPYSFEEIVQIMNDKPLISPIRHFQDHH